MEQVCKMATVLASDSSDESFTHNAFKSISTITGVIAVLAGGVGAARFLRGLTLEVEPQLITSIVNTGDDTVLHGLHISPDLDTVTYTLSGSIDPERGWGLENETWTAMGALSRYATNRPPNSQAAPTWFNLGDKDLATHFYRTARLAEGATLTQVTAEITRAWGLNIHLAPMTNDSVQTVITLAKDCEAGKAGTEISFQEYFVKYHHSVAASAVKFVGSTQASPNGLDDLASAESIVIAPSNPLVSIAPIRSLAGVDEILSKRRDSVCAISPIVNGAALKGPADRLMTELGHESTVVGVARIYAPICGTLIIDNADAHLASAVEAEGLRCIVTDTIMKTPQVSAALARTSLEATR
jgi:LPPG:FO 2-phospho-L-lactate transferase